MLKNNFKKSITTLIILISLSNVSPFLLTAKAVGVANSAILAVNPSSISEPTSVPTIIDAQAYGLDITGTSDTSVQFQQMINSFPSGSTIELPEGIYKLSC